ncbi:hypothetical protein ES708_10893 [subsurface metagenome]
MKLKCLNCGLVYEQKVKWKQSCPQCGEVRYCIKLEDFRKIPSNPKDKIDRESLEMVKDSLGEAYDMAKVFLREQEDLMRDPLKQQREAEKEGLMFEIFEYFNGKKTQVRKIYLDGHIEGFKGDPCITNHILPKIIALKAILGQMNRSYRDLIEEHLLADLPIDPIELNKLYQAQLKRVMDIKI